MNNTRRYGQTVGQHTALSPTCYFMGRYTNKYTEKKKRQNEQPPGVDQQWSRKPPSITSLVAEVIELHFDSNRDVLFRFCM